MKLNKSTITGISIAVGSVMLATAAFANFVTANGYSIYKAAVKDLVQERNYTMSYSIDAFFDGESLNEFSSYYEEIDLDTGVYKKSVDSSDTGEYYINEKYTSADGSSVEKINYTFTDDWKKILYAPTASVYDVYDYNVYGTIARNYDESQLDTLEKAINFAETAADLCVGDLKNNFVYLQDTDVGHEYQITVDSFQIPEIINAGLALVGSQYRDTAELASKSSVGSTDPFYRIYDDLRGKGCTCRIVVDNYGRLRENDITIDLVGSDAGGTEHTLSLVFNLRIDKYDETVPQEIDLSDCTTITYQSETIKSQIEYCQEAISHTTNEESIQELQNEIDNLTKILEDKGKAASVPSATFDTEVYTNGRIDVRQ